MTAPTPTTAAAEGTESDAEFLRTVANVIDDGCRAYVNTARGTHENGYRAADRLRAIAAALLSARRENEELRATLDLLYVDRYGITYQELERRIRDAQAGKAISHEEARAKILAAVAATQETR